MVSDFVLTKTSLGKKAFLQATYAFAPKNYSRMLGLLLIEGGEGDHAELQSYDLAATTEFSLSFSRRRMCESTILGLQSKCESNNFWSDL
jgi:hypothetical protein